MKPFRWLVISILAFAWMVLPSPRSAHAQKPSVNDLLVLDNVTVVDVRTGKLARPNGNPQRQSHFFHWTE